jgi:hypothetical protein
MHTWCLCGDIQVFLVAGQSRSARYSKLVSNQVQGTEMRNLCGARRRAWCWSCQAEAGVCAGMLVLYSYLLVCCMGLVHCCGQHITGDAAWLTGQWGWAGVGCCVRRLVHMSNLPLTLFVSYDQRQLCCSVRCCHGRGSRYTVVQLRSVRSPVVLTAFACSRTFEKWLFCKPWKHSSRLLHADSLVCLQKQQMAGG